jgi:hypothetical protein
MVNRRARWDNFHQRCRRRFLHDDNFTRGRHGFHINPARRAFNDATGEQAQAERKAGWTKQEYF